MLFRSGVEDDQDQCGQLCWFLCRCAQDVPELEGDIDGQGVHPHEEADEGVVGDVGEEVAARSEGVIVINQGEDVIDGIEEVVEADIDQESHDEFSKEWFSQLTVKEVDN